MLALLFLFVLIAVYWIWVVPLLAELMSVQFGAISAAFLAILHVWIEERFFGNQRDINQLVFKKPRRGRTRSAKWPVTDRHNKLLHQGFIAWFLLACCGGALFTGNPIWLVPVASVFLADFAQHKGFDLVAGQQVAGSLSANLYAAWFLLWWVWNTNEPSFLFYGLLVLGFVLIFGNLGNLALRNKRPIPASAYR